MIYFKLPFDEKLYSTDKKADKNLVNFFSFDSLKQISFDGNIIEIPQKHFQETPILSTSLPIDDHTMSAETEAEYIQKIEQVIESIKENKIPKLVLSRRKIIEDFKEIDVKESFKNVCKTHPNAFRYIFDDGENVWMGAFSEVLGTFNKTTHEFETMSLAGTLPFSENWSEKEIEEQKPVSHYIREILKKYTTLNTVKESETQDHISGNIKHLRTDFKAKIKPEELYKLIQELHPTPAVCGIPKDFCKEKIQKLEKFPREFYAGYIKIETENIVHFFVNLRCAKLYQNSVHLFVGGGITAQSNPKKEWIETELKSEAILKNLIIS